MSFLSNVKIEESKRRNLALQTIIAHRDLLQLANKIKQPPTYENALGLLNEIAPNVYSDFLDLLSKQNQSELVEYFHDLAEIKSSNSDTEISAIELIEKQIKNYENLLEKDPTKKTVSKRLMQHIVARESMGKVRLTENRILNRDYNNTDRTSYADKYFKDDFYTDYKLKNKNILRIRFLHPDVDEHITGADLIYEQYDLKKNKVRFVFLQYKTWDNNVIYKSQTKNLVPQLKRLTSLLCDNKLCHASESSKTSNKYRLPYCSGFLRPTDSIQDKDSKLMSSGFHIPVCNALKLIESKGKIEKKMIKEESFKSQIFEELFNSNMIGSRWIDVEHLENIYSSNNIFKASDRIKLYAQEMIEAHN